MYEGKMKEYMMRKSMIVGWMMEQFFEEEKLEIAVKKLEVKMK